MKPKKLSAEEIRLIGKNCYDITEVLVLIDHIAALEAENAALRESSTVWAVNQLEAQRDKASEERDSALTRVKKLEEALSYASSVFSELHVREAAECHSVYFAFLEASDSLKESGGG